LILESPQLLEIPASLKIVGSGSRLTKPLKNPVTSVLSSRSQVLRHRSNFLRKKIIAKGKEKFKGLIFIIARLYKSQLFTAGQVGVQLKIPGNITGESQDQWHRRYRSYPSIPWVPSVLSIPSSQQKVRSQEMIEKAQLMVKNNRSRRDLDLDERIL
jgi:hypothetical protein